MKNKPYSLYRNSGTEWIGQIPSHWEVTTLRRIGKIQTSSVDKKSKKTEKEIKLLNYLDVYNSRTKEIDNNINFMKVTASQNQIKSSDVKKGDIFFTPSSETVDDIGHSAVVVEEIDNLLFSYHLLRLRINREINLKFKKYLFNNYYVLNFFSSRATGTTRKTLGSNDFKEIQLIIPPFNEQIAIADFLDKKTAQINELLERKKDQIKTLQKYRQSLITEIVTKGLNGDVKMKDCGVEWIGEIPEHWEVKKLGFLGKLQNGISKSSDDFGFGFPFVSYSDVYNNIELPINVKGLVNSSRLDRNNYSVKKGDVFFTRTSETIEEIGFTSACLETIENATFAGFLIRFRPNLNKLVPGYSKYYFRSNMHRRYFVKEMNLVTRASLSQGLLKKLPVLIPTLKEQEAIANFLDNKCSDIDSLVTQIQQQIDVLGKYRQSLIYEAVTGKIDVQNYQENELEVE